MIFEAVNKKTVVERGSVQLQLSRGSRFPRGLILTPARLSKFHVDPFNTRVSRIPPPRVFLNRKDLKDGRRKSSKSPLTQRIGNQRLVSANPLHYN